MGRDDEQHAVAVFECAFDLFGRYLERDGKRLDQVFRSATVVGDQFVQTPETLEEILIGRAANEVPTA